MTVRHYPKGITRRGLLAGAGLGTLASWARVWDAAAATGPQPRRGGTAVVAIGTDPTTLNPAITTSLADQQAGVAIVNGLVWYDRALRIRPSLAESWEAAPDGMSHTFHLRRSVRWHDGAPFSSADVQFTFQEVLAKYHPRAKGVFAQVQEVAAPDPYTVVVRMKHPYAPFMQAMNVTDETILPKHLYEHTDIPKNPVNRKLVGTGPFRFQEWVQGDRIVVVRNDQYFEPGLPYLDRIVFKIIPDPHARAVALEAGEVDYIYDSYLGKGDYPSLSRDKRVVLEHDTNFPDSDVLIFNVRSGPLAQRAVRQAITHAINRQTVVERVFFGLGDPGRCPIDSRFTYAYNPAADYRTLYPYSPAKANALLDQAGFPRTAQGTRFALRLVFDTGQDQAPLAPLLKEQLRAVGIDLQLVGVQRLVMLDKVFLNPDFDMTFQVYNSDGDPAIGLQRLYISSEIRKAPFVNASGYSNPKVDELFAKGAAAVTVEERGAVYKQAQMMLSVDVPTLVLMERRRVDAASARLKGLWEDKIGYVRLAPAWLAPA